MNHAIDRPTQQCQGFVLWPARRLSHWELPVLVITMAFIGAAIGTGLDKFLRAQPTRRRELNGRGNGFWCAAVWPD